MPIADPKERRRLKVLVSCYACDPTLGSEPGMGGNWVLQLARHHDLWVLTEEPYALALAEYLERHCPELKPAIHIVGISRHRFLFGEKLWEPFFYYWTYRSWQRDAYREAQRLVQQIDFDLAHHLNMIGYREPGYLWKLPIPFVWGPIGGHAQVPWRFLAALGRKGALEHGLRNLLNWIQMRSSIRVKRAMRRADVRLAATSDDQEAIRRIHGKGAVLLNEQASNPISSITEREPFDGQRSLRVVWCGNFGAGKALPLALMAVQRAAKEIPLQLHIVGSGGCEHEWKSLAERRGLASLCHWYGSLSHEGSMEVISQSDVMLFTSLKEGTPAVVLEAIQSGVPVICHDKCGFGTVITVASGVKVPVKNPRLSIEYFAEAMIRFARNPELLHALSQGALQRAGEITWANQAKIMLDCYQQAIQSKPVK
ncbi:MAG: glycosyltransferase family 4 protein [Nitrospirales bacterium]